MAQVNKTVYPDVTGNSTFTSTLTISPANFPDYLISGLDPTITYAMSTSPRAPFKDVRSCYMDSNHPGAEYFFHTDDPQRVAICYGWGPRSGFDKTQTKRIMDNNWGENFQYGTQLVSAVKWNSIIGRLIVVWGIADSYDSITQQGYYGTWKDFKTYCVEHANENIVLVSAFIADVQMGGVLPRTRNWPAKCLNIRPMGIARWANQDGAEFVRIDSLCFQYEAMRPMSFTGAWAPYNGCSLMHSNDPDMFWPVYNYGYAISGASPDAPTLSYSQYGAALVYGVEEVTSHKYILQWPNMGQAQGSWIYGISVAEFGRETLFQYIEAKASTYGIIIHEDMKVASAGDGGFAANSLQSLDLSNPTNIPNLIFPVKNDKGEYNGDRVYTGDEIPDSVQDLIDGDKDTPYDEGASADDPTPDEPPEQELPDDNAYTDRVDLSNPTLTATGIFNRTYIMNALGVADLCDWIYNADDSIFEEIMQNMFTNNPIEGLINLRLYPFDIAVLGQHATPEIIKLGRTTSTVSGLKLPTNARCVIDLGQAVFPKFFKNWLDYEITAQLYIPFMGTVDLPVPQCLNHYISVKLIVDYVTGAGTAVIFADNIPILYKQGVIGIEIPMTATASAETSKSIIGNIVGAIGAGATGNYAGAVEQSISAFTTATAGSHLQQVGSSSPQCSLYQPKNCYLLFSLPAEYETAWTELQGQTVGFACHIPTVIGDQTGGGYAEFTNIRLDRCANATDEEKAEILNLLQTGVYL